MTQTIITAGDASNGLQQQAGNDGTLVLQTGPAGGKVNAVSLGADGTPTLVKGPTIGSAPTPVPSGSAPIYGCRAWCVFDGTLTGTNAPTAGGNVTSVTRNSLGNYTVNFATAMPDANYCVVLGSNSGTVNGNQVVVNEYSSGGLGSAPTTKTTTQIAICANLTSPTFAPIDLKEISVAIFR